MAEKKATETHMPAAAAQRPVEELAFEEALKELEQIVGQLERGDVPLADSIAFYERGEALKDRCQKLLGEAEARVEKIRVGADGKASGTTPLDPG
jgi:exodeoxyribonuclease VII small subunit